VQTFKTVDEQKALGIDRRFVEAKIVRQQKTGRNCLGPVTDFRWCSVLAKCCALYDLYMAGRLTWQGSFLFRAAFGWLLMPKRPFLQGQWIDAAIKSGVD
jgi:hypothetical protein